MKKRIWLSTFIFIGISYTADLSASPNPAADVKRAADFNWSTDKYSTDDQLSLLLRRQEEQCIHAIKDPLNKRTVFPLDLIKIVAAFWPTTFIIINNIDPLVDYWFSLPNRFVVQTGSFVRELDTKQAAEVVFCGGEAQIVHLAFTNPDNLNETRVMSFSVNLSDIIYKKRIIEVSELLDARAPQEMCKPDHRVIARYLIPGARGLIKGDMSFSS